MFRKSEVVTSLGSAAFLKKWGKKSTKKVGKKVEKKVGKKVEKKVGKKVEEKVEKNNQACEKSLNARKKN